MKDMIFEARVVKELREQSVEVMFNANLKSPKIIMEVRVERKGFAFMEVYFKLLFFYCYFPK